MGLLGARREQDLGSRWVSSQMQMKITEIFVYILMYPSKKNQLHWYLKEYFAYLLQSKCVGVVSIHITCKTNNVTSGVEHIH